MELQRWFAAAPGVRLVNAYGLTETSDDTNHEVMDRPPDGGPRAARPAVSNVRVYVVDEHLSPVPLGAPGEIVFSGVCVGRGYVNDPERTRRRSCTDPHRPGERLYRSGDYGRWRPDGKLEFLGRRDTQVRSAGSASRSARSRTHCSRVPGVRDAPRWSPSGPTGASAWWRSTPGRARRGRELRARLAASLPDYMVPASFHWREALPLTANGKVDRKALTCLPRRSSGG